ncbi:hypothetical protein IAQ61_011646, partial [Plenodomus lingam]|uniref:uncharacterized protein n=1 Tax=Leptosphaeria maculans TaxID=5022 RepID=UPI0033313060
MLLRYLLIWPHICIFACLPCPALPASSGMSVLVRRPRGSPAVVWGWVNTTHLLDTNCYAGCRFEHAQPKIALTFSQSSTELDETSLQGRWRQIPGDFDSFVLEFGYTFTSPTQLVYTE